MKKVYVSASSLPAGRNMSSQMEFVKRVANYGADIYHLDVMDGEFVKQKSIDYTYFDQIQLCSPLLLETHLMVKNPEKCLKKYLKTGVSIITLHYEVFDSVAKLLKAVKRIRKAKKFAGVAIDLDTDISFIDPIINEIDLVLIMTVKAGKGGQKFSEEAVEKIKHVRKLDKDILIEVDGGINDETGTMCVKAGADILVSGNYIYNNDTYESIQKLREISTKTKTSLGAKK